MISGDGINYSVAAQALVCGEKKVMSMRIISAHRRVGNERGEVIVIDNLIREVKGGQKKLFIA